MIRILLIFLSLLIISPAYSADDFFEKKPSILIAKDEGIQNNNSREKVNFFELSNQQKIDRTNQIFRRAERSNDIQ